MKAARRRADAAPAAAADADGGLAAGSLDAELAAPVAALSEKWKLLPAFLKVRARAAPPRSSARAAPAGARRARRRRRSSSAQRASAPTTTASPLTLAPRLAAADRSRVAW